MRSKIQEVCQQIRQQPLLRGSEKALAESLFASLNHVFNDQVVHIGGDGIYIYDTTSQLWQHIEDNWLLSAAGSFDGLLYGRGGKISISASKASGIIRCLKNLAEIYDPTFFDNPISGIAFKNTVLMCSKDGVTETPASPSHRLRISLSYEYHASEKPTKWLKLLDEVFAPDSDRVDKIGVLQEFLGISLINRAPQFDKCLVFVGNGANGKSTLIDIISLLVDKEGMASIPPQKWEDEYYTAMLDGKLLNLVSELPETKIVHSERFKAIVSGESVTSRSPYEQPRRIKPVAGHIFATNSLPPSTDDADGFWRRFIVLGFNRVFADGKTRGEILADIKPEIPAIAAWALGGGARLLNTGSFTQPASHKMILASWREESDSVAAWAKQQLAALSFTPSDATELRREGFKSSSLRKFYVNWCNEEGYKPVGARKFKHRLESLGFYNKRLEEGVFWAVRVTVIDMPDVIGLQPKMDDPSAN